MYSRPKEFIYKWTPVFVACAIIASGIFYFLGNTVVQNEILKYTIFIFSIPLWWGIVKSILKKNFGVDLIAGLALGVSIFLGQYIAGAIVLLMLSGGEALEAYAMRRAKKSLQDLMSLIPDEISIKTENGIKRVHSKSISVGSVIIVKSGEVIPVDGIIVNGESFVDESIMTGESLPVRKEVGEHVLAGTLNTDSVLEVKTVKPISESRLEGIIAMVRKAEEEKAPFVRLADKYSVYFTLFTFTIAGLAYFIWGDPVRLLAVLVVATPCPLILATPIAFMSGMSAASKRGIIVKNGGALEALDSSNVFVFDKTGTVTIGTPEVEDVKSTSSMPKDEIVRIAASLDQLSAHILARSLSKYAHVMHLQLTYPDNFKEWFGDGVNGEIDGIKYLFGKFSFIENSNIKISDTLKQEHFKDQQIGEIVVYLATEDGVKGQIIFRDLVRPEAGKLFDDLRKAGASKIMLVSGDKTLIVESLAKSLHIDEFRAEYMPDDKLKLINELKENKNTKVAMIGDGINDAPALVAANSGIALGSHGATAASDGADIVIISGSIDRVYDAYVIAKKSIKTAREGIFIGIGLSSICMIIALLGYLAPFKGALIQEGVDIFVILYALRAGGGYVFKNTKI